MPRHPSVEGIARFFDVSHYQRRDTPYEIATKVKILVDEILGVLPDSAELSAGLRKLLEAKDCLVRAAL